jgi:hypothetical protein
MSIFFNKEILQANDQAGRVMREQYNELSAMRKNGEQAHADMLAFTNAARTPAEAYREFDSVTKIDQVPAGEFATLTRLMGKAKPINIGRKLYEYRKSSDMNAGQSSMTGQIGVKEDKLDYSYGGAVVPIHDKAFGIDWREYSAMRAEGFDALVDYSREARRGLLQTNNDYLWNGNSKLVFKGSKWLGIKNDPTVASATLGVDLSASASSADDIRAEVARVRDILRITNNCSGMLTVVVSREIASNWERPFATADGSFGTIGDYISKLRGIAEIVEDDQLTGNQIAMFYDDQQGFHAVSGMAMSTYAVPRQYHNSPFDYIMWNAMGFVSKSDFAGRKCALYAE